MLRELSCFIYINWFRFRAIFFFFRKKEFDDLYNRLTSVSIGSDEHLNMELCNCLRVIRRNHLLDINHITTLSKKARAIYLDCCVASFGKCRIERFYSIEI